MRSVLEFFEQHSHELAQLVVLRNWKETETDKNDVHLLPTELDEKVTKMSHLMSIQLG